MGVRERIANIFHRYPEPAQPEERGLTDGVTVGDGRGRMREVALMNHTQAHGLMSQYTGNKFSGALNYPALWGANYTELRRRSRIAYWDSLQARSILRRLVDNEVHAGLSLEAQPMWDLLTPRWQRDDEETAERKRRQTRMIEARFHLWANSREASADGRMTFYQMMSFARLNKYRDGEIFPILRYSPNRSRMNPLHIQFVWPEQIRQPESRQFYIDAEARGNRIEHGIEWDANGAEIAFFVADPSTGKSVRIPQFGPKSGRIYMLHDMIHDSVGQPRGVPRLAHLVHEIQKITDYTTAEIEAAIINALYVLYIKPGESKGASSALTGAMPKDNQAQPETDVAGQSKMQTGYVTQPGMIVERLQAGEDIESVNTQRPNVNYEKFVDALTAQMGASLGVAPEVLKMAFNSNYSASKAAIEMTWKEVEHGRADLAAGFLNPVYSMWLDGEVRAGNLRLDGWDQPVIRRAWLNCQWTGISKPSVDPLKESKAATQRIQDGLTTRERESKSYNGTDYWDNVTRLQRENEALSNANASVTNQSTEMGEGRNSEEDEDDGNAFNE